MEKKRFVVIDSNALIHRAYHALPPLTTPKGELVNAVYGFLSVLFKIVRELEPEYVAAAFDLPGPTFRHQKFKDYKAKRVKAPPELYQQIPIVKNVLKDFGIPVFSKKGYEADDIIGVIARLVEKSSDLETVILTGDYDALQLVNQRTKVYALRKGIQDTVLYNEDLVKEKYQGLVPGQLADFKGLRGDPSDNIPGVPGVGEKTAIQLLKDFKNIENLYKQLERPNSIKDRLKKILTDNRDSAFLSKMLGEIQCDISFKFDLESCRFQGFAEERTIRTLEKLGFHSLIKRLSKQEPQKNNMTLF